MTFKRCTLHKTHLEAFKQWLQEVALIPYRDGKGDYQVLQVCTPNYGWQVVFRKADMPEHLSVNETLMPVVMDFYKYRKSCTATEETK